MAEFIGNLWLFEMGSKSGPDTISEILLQPMRGTPEELEKWGDSFWVRKDLVESLRAALVKIPEEGRLPRTVEETGVTCERRMPDGGPTWKRKEGLDSWDRVGPDRVCSFCGSIHPDDLRRLLDDPEVGIEISDKHYKVYIHRKGIPNAGFGAIKWYTWHGDQELIDAVNTWGKG